MHRFESPLVPNKCSLSLDAIVMRRSYPEVEGDIVGATESTVLRGQSDIIRACAGL